MWQTLVMSTRNACNFSKLGFIEYSWRYNVFVLLFVLLSTKEYKYQFFRQSSPQHEQQPKPSIIWISIIVCWCFSLQKVQIWKYKGEKNIVVTYLNEICQNIISSAKFEGIFSQFIPIPYDINVSRQRKIAWKAAICGNTERICFKNPQQIDFHSLLLMNSTNPTKEM